MPLSDEEIWQRVGSVASSYPLLECDKCAIAIMRWLARWEVDGRILRLRASRRSDVFITSARHSEDESITENGTHYGVEVAGKVFDNLSEDGLPLEEWIQDFNCRSRRFTVEEIPLSALIDQED